MSARDIDYRIASTIERATGRSISIDQANTLRRAEMTLRRWAELECGDSNDYASWAIERDEQTGRPYMVTYPHCSPFAVYCLNDDGAEVRATSKTFSTLDAAESYALTIAKSRAATIRRINNTQRRPIADRERGALKRVAKVCAANGLHFCHQTDPRGCALYVAAEPLNDSNYSTVGVAVC